MAKQLGEPETIGNLYDLNGLEVDEMTIDYNELLYKKVSSKYDAFLNGLYVMPVEQAMEKVYENAMKEEFLIFFQNNDLEQKGAKILYRQKYPLDYCYQEWLQNDFSYMDMLKDTISKATENAAKKMKAKSRESR